MSLRHRGYYVPTAAPPGFSAYWIPTQEITTMKKNVASQVTGVQLINSADGTAFTGTATALITVDGGTQSASGGTGPTHEGNGYFTYIPTQAETNGDQIGFTYTGTGAITATVQVYTSFPQTVDNNTKISLIPTTAMRGTDSAATAANLAIVDSNVDTILIDTNDLQTNQGNWLTATGFATTAEIADVPTVSEFNARTIPSADYFVVTDYTTPDNAGITSNGVAIAALNDIAATDIVTGGAITTSGGDASTDINKINGVTVVGDGSATPFNV